MLRQKLTAALTLLALCALRSNAIDCQFANYDDTGNYVNYDLRPLVSSSTYIFRAKIGSYHYRYQGQQYDYLINICDDVHPDAKHSSCNELAHAPAYQVTAPPPKVEPAKTTGKYTPPPPPPYEAACFRIADSGDVKFDFINSSNPEEGVKIKYRGGQKCRKRNTPEVIKATNETWKDMPREVEVQLMCDRDMGLDDSATMTDLINSGATINVEERSPPDECQYVIRWRTQHGCPYGGGYAKVSQGTISSGGSSEGWFMWLVRMMGYGTCMLVVFVVVVSLPDISKRFAQYQGGNFFSFREFLGYVVGDIQVRVAKLIGGGAGSLPTRSMGMGGHHGGEHLHSV